MAGIVRKLFKSGGGTSSKKANSSKPVEIQSDDDDDYAELQFHPTTSSAAVASTSTPKFTYSGLPLSIATPKYRHDDTLSDQSFEQPSTKRRRHQFDDNEESIYEHTQYQLMKWSRQADRHQERRKRKRAERHVEQENYVNEVFGRVKLENLTAQDVEKLRRERDEYKRDAERYKRKFEEMEKRCKQLERSQQQQQQQQSYQSFIPGGFNMFSGASFQLFQPPPPPALQPSNSLLLQPSTSNLNLNLNVNPAPSMAPPTMSNPFSSLGPSGPMAPRYPDPYNFDQDDDDTSLSDLSNSSKSDISSDGHQ